MFDTLRRAAAKAYNRLMDIVGNMDDVVPTNNISKISKPNKTALIPTTPVLRLLHIHHFQGVSKPNHTYRSHAKLGHKRVQVPHSSNELKKSKNQGNESPTLAYTHPKTQKACGKGLVLAGSSLRTLHNTAAKHHKDHRMRASLYRAAANTSISIDRLIQILLTPPPSIKTVAAVAGQKRSLQFLGDFKPTRGEVYVVHRSERPTKRVALSPTPKKKKTRPKPLPFQEVLARNRRYRHEATPLTVLGQWEAMGFPEDLRPDDGLNYSQWAAKNWAKSTFMMIDSF